jgi:hypothetical protein
MEKMDATEDEANEYEAIEDRPAAMADDTSSYIHVDNCKDAECSQTYAECYSVSPSSTRNGTRPAQTGVSDIPH